MFKFTEASITKDTKDKDIIETVEEQRNSLECQSRKPDPLLAEIAKFSTFRVLPQLPSPRKTIHARGSQNAASTLDRLPRPSNYSVYDHRIDYTELRP